MNEIQIEAALTISDPDSEARKKVEEAIRAIVRSEMERLGLTLLQQNTSYIYSVVENSFSPSNPYFRDGALSVLRDYLESPRSFNRKY